MKLVSGFQFKLGIAAFARKLAEAAHNDNYCRYAAGFQICFQGNGAATDCKGVIYLPNVDDNARLNITQVRRWTGYVLHEYAHVQITSHDDAMSGITRARNVTYARELWNAIEDGWIERWIPQRVPGAHPLLSTLIEAHYAEAHGVDWNSPVNWPFALALWARDHVHIRPPVPAAIAAIFDSAVRVLDDVQAENPGKLKGRTSDNSDLAYIVYTQIEQYLEDQRGETDEGEGEPEDGEGEGGQGEGGEGEGEGGQGDIGESEGSTGQGAGKGTLPPTLEGIDPRAVEPQPIGGSGDTAEERAKRIDETLNADTAGWINPENSRHDLPRAAKAGRAIPSERPSAKLKKEFKRLFDGSSTELWNNGKESGAVSIGRLHRHKFDDAVFRRREEREGIDTVVAILIDTSGSTEGLVIKAELDAADNLVEAIKPAGVKVGIYTFASTVYRATAFGEGVAAYRKATSALRAYGSTEDITALKTVAGHLMDRPESRKIMLVLTDGQGANGPTATRHTTLNIEKLGITVIGIGIGGSTAVLKAYTQAIEVRDLAELSEVSLKQIKLQGGINSRV